MLNPQTSTRSQTFAGFESAIFCPDGLHQLHHLAPFGVFGAVRSAPTTAPFTHPPPLGGGVDGAGASGRWWVLLGQGDAPTGSAESAHHLADGALVHAKNNTLEEPASFYTIGDWT